ncbi:MAG: hypothetical protein JKY09_01360 [Crocinitomicaceae bacterium]|nr:hypothetical protein [Crocinitomicaceae bacterium]
MKINKLLFVSLFAMVAMVTFVGCRKKAETLAKIHVRNTSNQPVAGARVILYGQPTLSPPPSTDKIFADTTTTNSAGEAIFNFDDVYQLGQAGVAVLNITAEKNGKVGQGIIKIEQETTSEETVFIQ